MIIFAEFKNEKILDMIPSDDVIVIVTTVGVYTVDKKGNKILVKIEENP